MGAKMRSLIIFLAIKIAYLSSTYSLIFYLEEPEIPIELTK